MDWFNGTIAKNSNFTTTRADIRNSGTLNLQAGQKTLACDYLSWTEEAMFAPQLNIMEGSNLTLDGMSIFNHTGSLVISGSSEIHSLFGSFYASGTSSIVNASNVVFDLDTEFDSYLTIENSTVYALGPFRANDMELNPGSSFTFAPDYLTFMAFDNFESYGNVYWAGGFFGIPNSAFFNRAGATFNVGFGSAGAVRAAFFSYSSLNFSGYPGMVTFDSDLTLTGSGIVDFPGGAYVGGDLVIHDTIIQSSGNAPMLEVQGDLVVSNATLLVPEVLITGSISFGQGQDSDVSYISSNLFVGSQLAITGTLEINGVYAIIVDQNATFASNYSRVYGMESFNASDVINYGTIQGGIEFKNINFNNSGSMFLETPLSITNGSLHLDGNSILYVPISYNAQPLIHLNNAALHLDGSLALTILSSDVAVSEGSRISIIDVGSGSIDGDFFSVSIQFGNGTNTADCDPDTEYSQTELYVTFHNCKSSTINNDNSPGHKMSGGEKALIVLSVLFGLGVLSAAGYYIYKRKLYRRGDRLESERLL